MLAVRTPGAPQTARGDAGCGSAFPFERQGRPLRSRSISGLFSRSLYSGLQPPCLRFAAAVTGRHARLGTRLLARLCRDHHLRRQTSTRLQGATLAGRVEDWRAGLGRSLGSLLSRPFVCECPTISTVPRLQSPPRRTQLTGFPYYAPPFASCQGLWDLSCRSDFRHVSPHPIAVEQPKSVVNPLPTPSLPAEALSFPGMR